LKILLTGGNGFLGKHLQHSLHAEGIEYRVFNRDLNEIGSFEEKFDVLIHLAAKLKSNNDDFNLYEANVIGTQCVIDLCIKQKAKLIFLSTSGVYGESDELISVGESSFVNPQTAYPISKFLGEKLCERAHNNADLNAIMLRIFNVFGPDQKDGFIIPDILTAIKVSKPLILKTPYANRDFVYISDVIRSIILSLFINGFHTINIGSGNSLSILALVEKIEMILDRKIEIDLTKVLSDTKKGISADISTAKRILNWEPRIDLCSGLTDVLKSEGLLGT